MSTVETLLELAEQVERLTGPSYDLNEQTGDAVGAEKRYQHPGSESEGYPNFLVSLDAAMTLVPEGWNWMAGNRDQPKARAWVERGKGLFPERGRHWYEVVAATPALALTAACLRARAAILTEETGGQS